MFKTFILFMFSTMSKIHLYRFLSSRYIFISFLISRYHISRASNMYIVWEVECEEKTRYALLNLLWYVHLNKLAKSVGMKKGVFNVFHIWRENMKGINNGFSYSVFEQCFLPWAESNNCIFLEKVKLNNLVDWHYNHRYNVLVQLCMFWNR